MPLQSVCSWQSDQARYTVPAASTSATGSANARKFRPTGASTRPMKFVRENVAPPSVERIDDICSPSQ